MIRITLNTNIIAMIATTIAIGIHIGLNTYNHDQAITRVSLRTTKIKVKHPKNPMPPPALELSITSSSLKYTLYNVKI